MIQVAVAIWFQMHGGLDTVGSTRDGVYMECCECFDMSYSDSDSNWTICDFSDDTALQTFSDDIALQTLMSLFWKKMKALFLQTKICEVSQIRISKNPPCLVVNKHLLKVETSNQTW